LATNEQANNTTISSPYRFNLNQTSSNSVHLNTTATAGFKDTTLLTPSSFRNLDETSFRGASNQSFDFTFTSHAMSDQSLLIKLKEAFQFYLRKEERECESIVEEILMSQLTNNKLDLICLELSEKFIDDVPAHDPRWAELSSKGKSLNTNLIITNQLKSKIRIHEYYITFLKKFQVWDKLSIINYNGRNIYTHFSLQEHGEKLQCALLIREQLYTKNPEFINSAIEYTIKNREDSNIKLVYPHDLFYRFTKEFISNFDSNFYLT
jgi:hypothetical protein